MCSSACAILPADRAHQLQSTHLTSYNIGSMSQRTACTDIVGFLIWSTFQILGCNWFTQLAAALRWHQAVIVFDEYFPATRAHKTIWGILAVLGKSAHLNKAWFVRVWLQRIGAEIYNILATVKTYLCARDEEEIIFPWWIEEIHFLLLCVICSHLIQNKSQETCQ